MRDPQAYIKFFDELDYAVDPFGERAIKKLDLKVKGPFCHQKGFNSARDAIKALEASKSRISDILNSAKQQQI